MRRPLTVLLAATFVATMVVVAPVSAGPAAGPTATIKITNSRGPGICNVSIRGSGFTPGDSVSLRDPSWVEFYSIGIASANSRGRLTAAVDTMPLWFVDSSRTGLVVLVNGSAAGPGITLTNTCGLPPGGLVSRTSSTTGEDLTSTYSCSPGGGDDPRFMVTAYLPDGEYRPATWALTNNGDWSRGGSPGWCIKGGLANPDGSTKSTWADSGDASTFTVVKGAPTYFWFSYTYLSGGNLTLNLTLDGLTAPYGSRSYLVSTSGT